MKILSHRSISAIVSLLLFSVIFSSPVMAASVQTKTIAPGTKYATPMYIIDSSKPGPVVMIVGGVHGNETAGYRAAAQVKNISISSGTLLVIPNANKRADERGVRYISGEGDLNRAFPTSSRGTGKNALARDIYQTVRTYNVDWLIDLHEGYDYSTTRSNTSVGQTIIYYPSGNASYIASQMRLVLNCLIGSSSKKFQLLRYPISGSLARSSAQFLGTKSFIVETCSKASLSTRVDYHLKAVNKFLSCLDMK
ncbi:MAG: succinylglutamate desuccinylase/aspartoacylase family protein [Deltaproteobacteria bacterium]